MWREILARHASSGMSGEEFCRVEGIHPTVLRRWRSRLKGKGEIEKAKRQSAAKAVTPFIDIGAVAASRASSAYQFNQIAAQWDDKKKALEWLEKAVRLRDSGLPNLKTDPLPDPLRSDTRFQAIEQALKFPN